MNKGLRFPLVCPFVLMVVMRSWSQTSPEGLTNHEGPCCFTNVSLGLTAIPFQYIPDVLGIWLTDNNLQVIDDFEYFPNLLGLFMDDNLLLEFPNLAKVNNTLRYLTVKRNKIDYIDPKRLDLLGNIGELYLNQNRFKHIPDVSGPGRSLYRLELTLSELTQPPILPKLGRNLLVYHYSTLSFESDNFPYLPWLGDSVTTLGVGGIDLVRITPDRLRPYKVLRQLDIYYNKFVDVPDLTPVSSTLVTLLMGDNPVKHVTISRINSLPLLERIQLDSCKIVRPPNLCRVGLGVRVVFANNPFHCDCHMRWVKLAQEAGVDVTVSSKPCSSPPHLKDVRWVDITLQQLTCDPGI